MSFVVVDVEKKIRCRMCTSTNITKYILMKEDSVNGPVRKTTTICNHCGREYSIFSNRK
jgi:hypothetical protein